MKLQRILLGVLLGVTMAGCTDTEKRDADALFQRATLSFETKNYSLAKLQADSIKLLYPKAFDTRAKAQDLLLHVDYAETLAGQMFTDSVLVETYERLAPLEEALYFDKDERYQEVGFYYAPRHRSEKNVGRTYMRPQVDERGGHSVVVFYRGSTLNAHTLRFTAPDATFVEVKATSEPYLMSDVTGRTERTDFVLRPIGGVSPFLSMHSEQTIKVTIIGHEGTASVPFSKADAEAFLQVYELAVALNSVNELEKQQNELRRRMDFVTRRIQADSIKHQSE